MRVVFTCVPQTGHVTPLLPLATALAEQGDDVVFASGADIAQTITEHHLAFREAGPPFAAWFGRLMERTRGTPGDGLPPDRIESYFVPRLFGEVGMALVIDDLLSVTREHRADAIVFDSSAFAGPLVAAVLGIRPILHMIGVATQHSVLELVSDAVSPIWREFGHDVPPDAGSYSGTTITVCPSRLDPEPAGAADSRPIRPTPLPRRGAARPAGPAESFWSAPVVYITLGTFSNTDLSLFQLLLDAVSGEGLHAFVTVGRAVDPTSLTVPAPGQVAQVAQFVPQAEILPHSAAVIHHAGAGTAFGVLAHGLPAVLLPQSADNFTIADRLARSGAGAVLLPDQVSVEGVRAALRRVMQEPAYRTAATELAEDIAGMPPPEEVAATL
jgi:UDP-N-acetylglucosamine:LPS N-acetylglucosamine transferase